MWKTCELKRLNRGNDANSPVQQDKARHEGGVKMAKRRSSSLQDRMDAEVAEERSSPIGVHTVTGNEEAVIPVDSSSAATHGPPSAEAMNGGSPCTNDATSSEEAPLVKKRRTKNFKWREDMAKKSTRTADIVTRIPPLSPQIFATWDDFIRAWTDYMVITKTLYRRRSSSSSASWNSKNRFKTLPVPDTFQYATMAYWCTHGCIQPSRSTGVRAHLHNRFTGCTARITADVVHEKNEAGEVRWFIRVRNQIPQHNHRISDEIFACYTNNSSVPDELLLGPATPGSQRHLEAMQMVQPDQEPINHIEEHVAVPPVSRPRTALTEAIQVAPGSAKEVLTNEQKLAMAHTELQPLLDELRRTPSRVIHKRLQDVSDLVRHFVSKWEQDRQSEERQLHFIAQSAVTPATDSEAEQTRLPAPRSLLAGGRAPEAADAVETPVAATEDGQRIMESEVI